MSPYASPSHGYRGTLPRRLVLETLSSLQDILFRVGDEKSEELLQDLIWYRSPSFAKDFPGQVGATWNETLTNFEYEYWGNRLWILHQLVRKPSPSNFFARWLERHATDRNTLYVAVVGLALTSLFGLLGCIVGVVQAVFSYQALQLGRLQKSTQCPGA